VPFVPGLFPLIFQREEGKMDKEYIEEVKQNAKEFLDINNSVIIFPFDDQVSGTLDNTDHIAKFFAPKPRANQSCRCFGRQLALTSWSQTWAGVTTMRQLSLTRQCSETW
jgi:hypothetical protein